MQTRPGSAFAGAGDSLLLRGFFFAAGLAPIASLCLALFEWAPLHLSTRFLVLPLSLLVVMAGRAQPRWGRMALLGLAAGTVACGVYDLIRLACVGAGLWADFVPVIGQLALHDPDAPPFWGYLWRLVGNGGGMGMAFAMLPWRSRWSGPIYGLVICLCLFATLTLSPHAQQILFPLTRWTTVAAVVGHLIYGGLLILLLRKWEAPTTPFLRNP